MSHTASMGRKCSALPPKLPQETCSLSLCDRGHNLRENTRAARKVERFRFPPVCTTHRLSVGAPDESYFFSSPQLIICFPIGQTVSSGKYFLSYNTRPFWSEHHAKMVIDTLCHKADPLICLALIIAQTFLFGKDFFAPPHLYRIILHKLGFFYTK